MDNGERAICRQICQNISKNKPRMLHMSTEISIASLENRRYELESIMKYTVLIFNEKVTEMNENVIIIHYPTFSYFLSLVKQKILTHSSSK